MTTPEEIAQQLIQIENKLLALTESLSNDYPYSEQLKKNQEKKKRYCLALERGYLEIAFMSNIDFSNYAGRSFTMQFEAYRKTGEILYAKIKKQLYNKISEPQVGMEVNEKMTLSG